MRKPVIDYRTFRLKKLREPQFNHLLYLLGWVGFFVLYFLTENLIPYEKCYPVHSRLDDLIPFCEYFVIPYVGWYFLIIGSLVYFALYNPDHFKKLMKFIIVTQVVGMAIYILFPNRQDLRPEIFPRNNLCTAIVEILYTIDTSTNVCPSLHVAYSLGMVSVWLKEKGASAGSKIFVCVFCTLVCMSVVFVKQHSVIDILAALPVCLLAEWLTFGRDYCMRWRKEE